MNSIEFIIDMIFFVLKCRREERFVSDVLCHLFEYRSCVGKCNRFLLRFIVHDFYGAMYILKCLWMLIRFHLYVFYVEVRKFIKQTLRNNRIGHLLCIKKDFPYVF